MRTAPNLAEWRTWCGQQGAKLSDGSIDVHSLFRSMIIPIDVRERPAFPILAMEWPWKLYLGSGTSSRLSYKDSRGIVKTCGWVSFTGLLAVSSTSWPSVFDR